MRAQAKEPFSYTLPAYGQPEPTTLDGDLDGLTYEATTGQLFGTPTKQGSYLINVNTPNASKVKTYTLRLDVLKAPPHYKTVAGGPSAASVQ